jgi:hypothetical protein
MFKLLVHLDANTESNSALARHHSTCDVAKVQTVQHLSHDRQQVARLADMLIAVPVECERKVMAICYSTTVWQDSGSYISKLTRSVPAGRILISSLSLLIALKFFDRTLFHIPDILCGCTV